MRADFEDDSMTVEFILILSGIYDSGNHRLTLRIVIIPSQDLAPVDNYKHWSHSIE